MEKCMDENQNETMYIIEDPSKIKKGDAIDKL